MSNTEIVIIDMPYIVAEGIIEQGDAPVWVSTGLENTVLRLYQTPVEDEDTGREGYGYMLALEMFNIPAWYCTVVLTSDEGGVAIVPKDTDVVAMFSELERVTSVPLPTYFALLRTASTPMLDELDIDPMLRYMQSLWLEQRSALIGAAMAAHFGMKPDPKTADPFASFIEDELEGLDD